MKKILTLALASIVLMACSNPAEKPEIKDKFKPENIHYNEW